MLLRPPLVTEDDGTALALRALSDLHALFKPRAPRTAAKIVFYAAQVRRASVLFLRSFVAEVERWAAKLEKEGEVEGSGKRREAAAQEVVVSDRLAPGYPLEPEKPLIVELY
jgi:hypothetical protein